MTQAVLNTQLYQKMFAGQEAFKAELIRLPPGEILQKAYEYVCREDILLSLEYNDLSPKQATTSGILILEGGRNSRFHMNVGGSRRYICRSCGFWRIA